MKKCRLSLSHQENANQNHEKILRQKTKQNTDKDLEKAKLLYSIAGNAN
jgi:hypothetical protein